MKKVRQNKSHLKRSEKNKKSENQLLKVKKHLKTQNVRDIQLMRWVKAYYCY